VSSWSLSFQWLPMLRKPNNQQNIFDDLMWTVEARGRIIWPRSWSLFATSFPCHFTMNHRSWVQQIKESGSCMGRYETVATLVIVMRAAWSVLSESSVFGSYRMFSLMILQNNNQILYSRSRVQIRTDIEDGWTRSHDRTFSGSRQRKRADRSELPPTTPHFHTLSTEPHFSNQILDHLRTLPKHISILSLGGDELAVLMKIYKLHEKEIRECRSIRPRDPWGGIWQR
jgi:hypothetical protein